MVLFFFMVIDIGNLEFTEEDWRMKREHKEHISSAHELMTESILLTLFLFALQELEHLLPL